MKRQTMMTLTVILISSVLAEGTAWTCNAGDQNSLPEHIDLRPEFSKLELGPFYQGCRGTCSVGAVVGALEYAWARKEGKGLQLSVEYLNWASNEALGQKIDGGFFSDLWKGFAVYGICPEQEMPYRDTFDPNLIPGREVRKNAQNFLENGLKNHWIKQWDLNTGLSDRQCGQIKHVLSRQWPVCAGLRWPRMPTWKNQVLEMATPENVFDGHSVLLVGYRDDPKQPGGGVFFFRNSSNNPPEGQMTYQYACAYMNDAMWIDCEIKEKDIPPSTIVKKPSQ